MDHRCHSEYFSPTISVATVRKSNFRNYQMHKLMKKKLCYAAHISKVNNQRADSLNAEHDTLIPSRSLVSSYVPSQES